MQVQRGICVSLFLLPVCLFAQERPRPTRPGAAAPQSPEVADTLPVKRVVLYKSGVGYFEHLGSVRDNQDVTIPFTSGQLNDVLKSLTVLDLDGGRITGVEYGSTAPPNRQLGDLRLPVGEKSSLTEFLSALRGARLEVRSGTAVISGRLLSVERKTRIAGGTTLEVDYLALLADNGELKTTELSPAFSVRLLEPGLAGKMERFLDVVSAGREADVRPMVISTTGSGQRSLFVSYLSEVPVWKTTYRVVLSSKAKPLLQGWAIVDNTVGEDWEQVQLSLVAGAPHSFIQNLSQPYYARRPVVPLPEAAEIAPQTYEATLVPGAAQLFGIVRDQRGAAIANASVKAYDPSGRLIGTATANAAGRYEFDSLPEGSIRLDVEAAGFRRTAISGLMATAGQTVQQDALLQIGSTAESVNVSASASTIQTETAAMGRVAGMGRSLGSGAGLGGTNRSQQFTRTSPAGVGQGSGGGTSAVESARAAAESAASAQELGDLFEYKLKEPITIRKNRSALVPIVQASISAEKVSVWNERAGLPRPLRALWLTNSSGLTLDGGSFNVIEDETFAGEGIFEPIRPGEKRLISFATDLALNVSSHNATERQRVSRAVVAKGMMTFHEEIREKKTYTFRNEDTVPRTVIVEHPVRNGYELRGDVQPVETTAAWKRFQLPVGAKQTAKLVVDEARLEQTAYQVSNLTDEQLALFVREKSIDPSIEAAFRRVLTQKDVIANLDSQKDARQSEMNEIFDDQQRLRENMKALRGSAEEKALLERYTQQLNEQENRLAALRKESEQLEARQTSAQADLDRMIEELAFDVKM
ncbi:MAG TPA: carboxypeptidase regulatory-like domain-containing protein [Bryobacteraceae bacterium]|nr:carboxypeptidase regulatory-like domain-containing protein [Bryobacteraceae bacterium]